jgi:hypothetical protein
MAHLMQLWSAVTVEMTTNVDTMNKREKNNEMADPVEGLHIHYSHDLFKPGYACPART